MISKLRSIPLTIQKEEALLRRLPLHHSQYPAISASLAKRKAGYKGEQAIDYYLTQLDDESCHIFHDLRFRTGSHFFQIDTLLLTPHYLLIIEVKNISGTIYFDADFNQLIRTLPDREEGFSNPLSQAMIQKERLQELLLKHGFSDIALEYVVVISHPSTVIKASTSAIAEVVIHAESLLSKTKELTKKHAVKELAKREVQQLTKLFLKNDIPLNPNVLQKYQLSPSDILSGVQCPDCNFLPMIRKKRKWYCPSCKIFSSSAHQQAIQDYFLLISPIISNQACRKFIHHNSKSTVQRYLLNMGLKRTGSGNSTIYQQ